MSDTDGQTSQEQPALWHVAHGPDEKLRKHIRARFQELYEAAGEPQGVALYEGVDSGGFFSAVCINPEAARLFPELLSESSPWYAYEHRPNILHWGLVVGDERLLNR